MPLDPSISLQTQQFDPMASYGKALSLKTLMGQQQLQGLQIDQAERESRDTQTLADLHKENLNPDGSVNRSGLIQSAAAKGLGAKIPGLQKLWNEADESGAKLQKLRGEIGEQKFKALKDSSTAVGQTAMSLLSGPSAPSENDVMTAMGSLVSQGVFNVTAELHGTTPDEIARQQLATMPRNNPEALTSWLRQVGMRNLDTAKQFEMITPKFEKIDAGNRVVTGTTNPMTGQFTPSPTGEIVKAPEGFIVGPNGSLTADPGFVRAKSQIAAAGRPLTTVSVNTAKPLLTTMAEGLGKQLDDSLATAQTAQQTIGVTQRMQSLLNNGNLITGPGAEPRLLVNQVSNALGVGGANDAEKLANTRQLMQSMAQLELQAGAAMKGQGAITESERAILKAAAGGQINMSAPELKALTQTLEDRAYKRIEAHQTSVKRLEAIPDAKTLMPFYNIETPARASMVAPPTDWKGAGYASKAQAVQDARTAISKGADKAVVIKRLEAAGITNHGIK